jgi:hypothetical protein
VNETRVAVKDLFKRIDARDQGQKDVISLMEPENLPHSGEGSQGLPSSERLQEHVGHKELREFGSDLARLIGFHELGSRYHKIAAAHAHTFGWIYSEDPSLNWSSQTQWFRDPTKTLYWITGKPASGKSTLMKFI